MANTKKAVMARRAWEVLRIALLWARRGGSLRRGLMSKIILMGAKNVGRASSGGSNRGRIRYLEREFSFGETPAFSFRMHWPASLRMPCFGAPAVDFDEDDYDCLFCKGEVDKRNAGGDYMIEDEGDKDRARDSDCEAAEEEDEEEEEQEEEEEGIDSKAEEFIANFYEQMKMQRQVSLLRYNEMIQRGVC